jgi:hypothetical protein
MVLSIVSMVGKSIMRGYVCSPVSRRHFAFFLCFREGNVRVTSAVSAIKLHYSANIKPIDAGSLVEAVEQRVLTSCLFFQAVD